MSEWHETTLGQLGTPSKKAFAAGPFGSAIASKFFTSEGVPVIRGSNLSLEVGERLLLDNIVFVSDDKARQHEQSIAVEGDLVFTCWGTIGQVGLVDGGSSFDRFLISNKQMRMTPDPDRVDSLYLYYLLSSPPMVRAVQNRSIGAAVPGFNLGQLQELQVVLPDLPTQRRIVSVLSALDEVIAINERRIEVLEDVARSLYREWFVRFRFPGHSADPARPADWLDCHLRDIAAVVTDGVDPTEVAPSVPYCGLEHLPRRQTTLRRWGSIESVTSRKLRFREGDTLFGKIRPYFHKVVWSPFDGVASSDAIVFRATGATPVPALAATMLSSDELVADAVATSNGTKMPRADPKAILNYAVALPPLDSELVRRAEKSLRAIYDSAASFVRTNRACARTRDLILPRLVSGRLDVSDVDLGYLLPAEAA